MKDLQILHYSVMANEVRDLLAPVLNTANADNLLLDCTLGEGGHSQLFLESFPAIQVIGLDRDSEIIEKAKKRLSRFGDRFQVVNTWFDNYMEECNLLWKSGNQYHRPIAILIDFGISIFHYEASGRGFSFSKDEPLDMRLDENGALTAEMIVNTYEKDQLADIIYAYGEERYSRRIASAICRRRVEKSIRTSADLVDIIKGSVPKDYRHGRIHPATRTFQALRIEVNGELDRIKRVLNDAADVLLPGGRIAVISFHSLEDRIVKQTFRDLAKTCSCPPEAIRCECDRTARMKLITKKPLRPGEKEIAENAASRSAKVRCIEKVMELR